MRRDSPRQALAVVTLVVVACALLVSAAVVVLRPIHADNRLLRQARVVVELVAGKGADEVPGDRAVIERFRSLDARVVNLDSGQLETGIDPFDLVAGNYGDVAQLSTAIPAAEDWARLGQRPQYAVVYLLWGGGGLEGIVLPVYGTGMWSTIRGFVMLEGDLNTVAGATIFEQAETPGVGDRITRAEWLDKWRGRKVYDEAGVVQFAVAAGPVAPGSASELHDVDAITGATVTADAVTHLMRFWFGPWGFQRLLQRLEVDPPERPQGVGAAP